MSKLKLIASASACHFRGRRLAGEPLTKEDWREVFWFMKCIYLPFMHRIVARARARAKAARKA
jgi:hypothetical protein